MEYKNLIKQLGFTPKDNASGIFQKKYNNDYVIEINFEKEEFNFGKLIKEESRTTQNFSQKENWVVIECVNRLLDKGYLPQNITLEKTWKTGHGTSGRLDVLVTQNNDDSAYLMIECKTWGAEFDKEYKQLQKDGGQLFTYFQQDKDADVLMLYASELDGNEVKYRNEIVKVEEDYRQTGNVKDFYERWNKLPKSSGIFDSWAKPYEFQSKALTLKDLKALKQEDSSFIFNRFLEILRHNVVSDKPNAFNKIFTLFLCKIVDEGRKENDQLHFQWIEGEDDHISFQKRLTDLYNKGMKDLLEKTVTDVSDSEFDKRFQQVDDKYKDEFKEILTEIRLKKNNEFAIKEVYDDASFLENAKVVKEVVELLQDYQIRYNYRQQFLSDFFELLLTTGLKQESGQFFTPVPIARFIIKSIPANLIAEQKIKEGNKNDLLPTVIDYAGGSGHFITETMEEIQKFIESTNEDEYNQATNRALKRWKDDPFEWAEKYVYAIEKDYRLVKTAKVSCYLHGDGLAKVIHGDGLGDFSTSTEFKDLLKETDKIYPQDNKQFDIIFSNPPYSVSAFKGSMMEESKAKKAFDLYARLTDQSSEIECLFIERTKQLLKDGGIAGIILPSSILSNTGIYSQTREIILKYFEIVAIAELGSSTFMATGTNTVTLFLKRRNNADCVNIEATVDKFFNNKQDYTNNGIEKPAEKYINHVWEDITIEDYITLINKNPNENIQKHEIFEEYKKKIKAKNEKEQWDKIIELEKEKLFYFVLSYPQKIVLVKTGQKKEEKQFLGYEFSNRRGSEGIHPIQRGKTIDECTQLYDADTFDNVDKASTYIYKAFAENKFDLDIPESLQKNISYQNLVDMFSFDRVDFEKNISLSAKKKVKIESKWELSKLIQLMDIVRGASPRPIREFITNDKNGINWIKIGDVLPKSKFISKTKEKITAQGAEKSRKVKKGDFILSNSMSFGRPYIMNTTGCIHDGWLLLTEFDTRLNKDYLYNILSDNIVQEQFVSLASGGTTVDNLNIERVSSVKIPLPPKNIQEKIVSEIEVLESKEKKAVEEIEKQRLEIVEAIDKSKGVFIKLEDITSKIGSGATPRGGESSYKSEGINLIRSQNIYDRGMLRKGLVYIDEIQASKLNNVTIKPNDVLFNITGASVCRCCIVEAEYLPARVNQHVSIIRANSKVNPKYLHHILISPKVKARLLEIAESSSTREAVTKLQLEEFKIPLPSIEEQKQIVSEIEKIETKINKLEELINETPKKKDEILKKYL